MMETENLELFMFGRTPDGWQLTNRVTGGVGLPK
jgi:hypothetical protein